MKLLYLLVGLIALTFVSSCGGGGGGGSSAPPAPPTGEISGYITIDGTTASSAPVSSVVAMALDGASDDTAASADPSEIPVISNALRAEPVNEGGAESASGEDTEVLLVWADGASHAERNALLDRFDLRTFGSNFGNLYSYRLKKGAVNPTLQAELLKENLVNEVTIIPLAQSQFVPTETGSGGSYDFQWNMKQMGLERAWDVTRGSSSVRVAVLDSGFPMTSVEFTGRFVDGYDFVTDVVNANDGDGRDADPTDTRLSTSLGKLDSHGTHVVAIIGANSNNGGMVGVDHMCKIIPIRAGGSNGLSTTDVWASLIYAADLTESDIAAYSSLSLDPSRPRPAGGRVDVINLSIGGAIPSGAIRVMYLELLAAVRAKGCVIVVAAGNEDSLIDDGTTLKLPAGSPDVVCVGATTSTLERAVYSNFGPELTLMSCGGNKHPDGQLFSGYSKSGGILSLDIDNELVWANGTSMAAPHVTGIVSLMFAVNPSLTPDEVDVILAASCYDLGTPGYDTTFGHGFLMADRAVNTAASNALLPELVSFTDTVFIDRDVSAIDWTVVNAGGAWTDVGTLSYNDTYISGSGWITGLTAVDQGTDGNLITITVDRTGLSDGTYEADVTLTSTLGGAVVVHVVMKVQAVVPVPSFTEVFMILMDANTHLPVQELTITLPNQGFTFSGVPAGSYYIVAGTDENGDNFIDDIGEYFGFHSPEVEEVIFTFDPAVDQSGLEVPLYLQIDLDVAS